MTWYRMTDTTRHGVTARDTCRALAFQGAAGPEYRDAPDLGWAADWVTTNMRGHVSRTGIPCTPHTLVRNAECLLLLFFVVEVFPGSRGRVAAPGCWTGSVIPQDTAVVYRWMFRVRGFFCLRAVTCCCTVLLSLLLCLCHRRTTTRAAPVAF